MAAYQHFNARGTPGEGMIWLDRDGNRRVGHIYFSIIDTDRTGDDFFVDVWMRTGTLDDAPTNLLLAALPADAWLEQGRRPPYIYPLSVDEADDRRAAEAAYHACVSAIAADIAAWAGDVLLMTLLADGMPVVMALAARQLLEHQP